MINNYYEGHVHEFSEVRLTKLVPEILRLRPGPETLLDIGCGVGNTMASLGKHLGIPSPVGVESSIKLAQIAASKTGHRVIHSSVLEDDFSEHVGQRFDVVVLSAVLHHLVGKTRRTSWHNINRAIANAKSVVAPGGLLVVHEPVFRPAVSLSILFYVKLVLGVLTRGRRLPLGSYWANVGAPLVSFMTPGQLRGLFGTWDYLDMERTGLTPLAKLGGIFARYDASLIVRVPE